MLCRLSYSSQRSLLDLIQGKAPLRVQVVYNSIYILKDVRWVFTQWVRCLFWETHEKKRPLQVKNLPFCFQWRHIETGDPEDITFKDERSISNGSFRCYTKGTMLPRLTAIVDNYFRALYLLLVESKSEANCCCKQAIPESQRVNVCYQRIDNKKKTQKESRFSLRLSG